MMKRMIACVLAVLMLLPAVLASAAEVYTLSEKIALQMNDGSGLKGNMVLSATGEAEWAKTISAVAAGDYQLRTIKNGAGYLCELYAAEGDAKKAVTTLYIADGSVQATSELLPGIPLTMATDSALLDMIFGDSKAGNPTWYSAAANMLGIEAGEWNEAWEAALTPYYTDLEVWMLTYSAPPVIREDANGETILEMRYEIPADAIGTQILSMLTKAVQDETLMTLLRSRMTDEQIDTYLSAERLYHYENVLKALPVQGSILLERKVTTLGIDLQSRITLPLTANNDGWQTLTIQDTAGDMVFTAVSGNRTVELSYAKADTEAGGLTTVTWKDIPAALAADSMAISWKLTIGKAVETRTDDDTRAHEITTWTINMEQDLSHLAEGDAARSFYAPIDAVNGTVVLHLSSKNSNSSPTTAAFDVNANIGNNTLTVTGQVKTAAPWVTANWKAVDGEEITAMEEDRRTELLEAFLKNALDMLSAK